jgi:cytoskeletal protein CcmA (bactofilin family)
MFHRPRIQVRPATTDGSAPEVETEVTTPDDDTTDFSQPQPTAPKEDAPMSNNFTVPAYNNDAASDTTMTTQNQMPTTAPFTPNRAGMPVSAGRTPYSYGQGGYVPAIPEASVSTGRKLIISEGITMSGEIEACDHLIVEGTVEATLKGASVLDISQSGMFFGAVEINEATVAGRFEGDLMVNGRLTIRATGTVTGTISYKELVVEAGATLDGKLSPMTGNRVATTDKKSSGQNQQKTSMSKGSNDPGNELPFSGNKVAAA